MDTTSVKAKKRSLMFVGHDKQLIGLFINLFEKHFILQIAENSDQAFNMIKSGLLPSVIIACHELNGIKGDEFLEKSILYSPESIRIILSTKDEHKEMVYRANRANVFMSLTFPIDELYLVQVIRSAMDLFNKNLSNKVLSENVIVLKNELSKQSQLLKKINEDNNSTAYQITKGFEKIFRNVNKYYYHDHNKFVKAFSMMLGQELSLPNRELDLIDVASSIHPIIYNGLPLQYLYSDPSELIGEDFKKYYEIFSINISILDEISVLKPYSKVVSQLWEHKDGSGFPSRLSGSKIFNLSQIISIANYYSNMVFSLNQTDLHKAHLTDGFKQTFDQTMERHEKAIKFFHKKSNWFDPDLTKVFYECSKRKDFNMLMPKPRSEETVSVSLKEGYKSEIKELTGSGQDDYIEEVRVTVENNIKKVEKDVQVPNLKAGMISAHDVQSSSGYILVKKDQEIDESLLLKIKKFEKMGLIGKILTVVISQDRI